MVWKCKTQWGKGLRGTLGKKVSQEEPRWKVLIGVFRLSFLNVKISYNFDSICNDKTLQICAEEMKMKVFSRETWVVSSLWGEFKGMRSSVSVLCNQKEIHVCVFTCFVRECCEDKRQYRGNLWWNNYYNFKEKG